MHARARIETNGEVVEGEIENISISGARVISTKKFIVNSSVSISIFDESSTSRTVFDIKAKVVWNMGTSIGLQFT